MLKFIRIMLADHPARNREAMATFVADPPFTDEEVDEAAKKVFLICAALLTACILVGAWTEAQAEKIPTRHNRTTNQEPRYGQR